MIRIGIDLGGTKTEAIALDDAGRELLRRRVPTPTSGYQATLSMVRALVDEVEAAVGAAGAVGIGTPGAVSPATGLMKNANSTHLNGRPFAADLEAALGRRVRLANDANCFALSEAVDGAGAGHRVVFGVILGTGVGGGIVIDQRPWTGPQAIGGEWGHNEMPWRGEPRLPALPCYCGRVGCIETYLSGPALGRDHARSTGEALTPIEIVARAQRGDAGAVETLKRFQDRLARGLAGVINLLDPDIIVLGGGLSNIDEIYREVPRLLPRYVFSDLVETPVVRNRHGDSSGVRGAAWLWQPAPSATG